MQFVEAQNPLDLPQHGLGPRGPAREAREGAEDELVFERLDRLGVRRERPSDGFRARLRLEGRKDTHLFDPALPLEGGTKGRAAPPGGEPVDVA
jgi:hypothetical protein